MRYNSYSFLTWALDGGEWSASRPGRALPPGKGPPVPIGQEVGPRAGLDAGARRKILRLCRGSNPGRPVRSQTLRNIFNGEHKLWGFPGTVIPILLLFPSVQIFSLVGSSMLSVV
jgi:hypothetical protein